MKVCCAANTTTSASAGNKVKVLPEKDTEWQRQFLYDDPGLVAKKLNLKGKIGGLISIKVLIKNKQAKINLLELEILQLSELQRYK